MKLALALALLATPAAADPARVRGAAPAAGRRRRLADKLDMKRLASDAEAGKLGARIKFKLDGDHRLAKKGKAAKLAGQVAAAIDCDSKTKRVFREAGKHEADHVAAGLDLWYEVRCSADAAADRAAVSKKTYKALKKFLDSDAHDGVLHVEPELEHATSWTPDDPQLGSQPHYDAINMAGAWDVGTGNADVVVQVLDTGIDMAHPDLQMNIWRNEGEICGNGVDDDNNGFVDDCHGYNHADGTGTDLLGNHWHGTHCGGTVAADSNNGVGVAGVAGGDGTPDSGVKLMISVGFGDVNVGGFAEALVYGADNGAQISSNSWGYTVPGMYEQAELDAIDYYNTKNGIVVFAAGNDDSEADYYPGYYDGTVAVAAVENNGVRTWFSNYGDWIEISAPGENVHSTLTDGQYGVASGTSMACPHVAGVLALGKSVDMSRSKEDLLECMYSTATDIDGINGAYAGKLGAGNVDAAAFMDCVANGAPSAAPTVSPAPTTAAPSLSPTVSPAPTPGCGVCDQTLKLDLVTDNYPAETTWHLKIDESAPSNCVDPDAAGGPYDEPNTRYEELVSDAICAGETYHFEILDSWGDGICCGWGDGSYDLYLDGEHLHSGGDFFASETFTFVAPAGGGGGGGDDDEPPAAACESRFSPADCLTDGDCCWDHAASMCYTAGECAADDDDDDDDDWDVIEPTQAPTAEPTTAAPSRAPTAAPTVLVVEPPKDITLKTGPKLGPFFVLRVEPHQSAAAPPYAHYHVQYQLKGTSAWVTIGDVATQMEPIWTGDLVHILDDPMITCGVKLKVRVAAIAPSGNPASQSDWVASRMRKLKC